MTSPFQARVTSKTHGQLSAESSFARATSSSFFEGAIPPLSLVVFPALRVRKTRQSASTVIKVTGCGKYRYRKLLPPSGPLEHEDLQTQLQSAIAPTRFLDAQRPVTRNPEAVNPMSIRSQFSLPAVLSLSALVLTTTPSRAATWQTVSNYGSSGGPTMTLYVPDKVAASPGIVISLHFCGGQVANSQPWFKSLADSHGFIIIAPKSVGECWDASLGRSGEKQAIAKMVEYVIANNNADKTRVFTAGASSGACMTQALLASYPEVFAAGSVLAGVPAGAWPQGSTCSLCSGENPNDASHVVNKSPEQWGEMVRAAAPSFSGTRPRVQLWHGTQDQFLNYGFLAEEIDEWTSVLGVSSGTSATPSDSKWKRTEYKDSSGTVMLQVNIGDGLVHDLTQYNPWTDIVSFFGLDKAPAGTGGTGGAGGTTGATGGASAKSSSAAGGTGPKSSSGAGGAATSGSSKTSSSNGAGGSSSSKASSPKASGGSVSSTDEASGGSDTSSDNSGEGGSDSQTTRGGSKSTSKTSASKGGSTNTTKAGSTANSTGASSTPTSTPATGTNDTAPADSGCSCGIVGDGPARGATSLFSVLAGLLLASRRRRKN